MSGDLSPPSCSASLWQQGEPVRQHKTLKPNALRDTGKGLFCVDWAWEYMCISVHLQLAFLDSWRGFRHSECEGDSYIVKYLLCCLIIRLSLWCIYSPFTIFFAVVRCIKSKPSKPSWKSNYTLQILLSVGLHKYSLAPSPTLNSGCAVHFERQAGVITAVHLQGKWLWDVTALELVMRSGCHFYQQGPAGRMWLNGYSTLSINTLCPTFISIYLLEQRMGGTLLLIVQRREAHSSSDTSGPLMGKGSVASDRKTCSGSCFLRPLRSLHYIYRADVLMEHKSRVQVNVLGTSSYPSMCWSAAT